MSENTIDVLGIGNAIVDVLARCEDATLRELAIPKGNMRLIEEAEIARIYEAMGPATEISGGSAANTIAGIASFGGTAAFIGRVADDEFGRIFAHDLRASGVTFDSAPVSGGAATARSLVLITPDAERTMNTYLGVSPELDTREINAGLISRTNILYLEGYLYDRDAAKTAIHQACTHAAASGTRIALSLSDTFCVERHRDAFHNLIETHVDILFANADEIIALTQATNLLQAEDKIRNHTDIIAITDGDKGSIVVRGSEKHRISAQPVQEVVDTTGAGDLYAAGFLYGMVQNRPLTECGRLGGIAAAEVISHIGARPETRLSERTTSL